MKFSLSTNWCNRRMTSGEEIAEKALSLGFDELELGFHTTSDQVPGFKRYLDRIRVGSVHAFCPVPISAPQGYPELYALASFDAEARAMARLQVTRNVTFAAEMGADAVVLHAGRVMCPALFASWRRHRRRGRGLKMVDVLRTELDALLPVLEKHGVTLALENLPYYEGFPNEEELTSLLVSDFGAWVKGWFDTGHDRVRMCNGWRAAESLPCVAKPDGTFVGMHLNDVVDVNDDHLAPGDGKVDFVALRSLAESVRHVVFEPNAGVSEDALAKGLALIRRLWTDENTTCCSV